MKLFKILVLHGAPKDSHTSIETYLIADNEAEVAEFINKEYQHGCWFDADKDLPEVLTEENASYFDDEGGPCTFKAYVMANKGDLKDDQGWEDAYYGVTKYGWEEVPDVEVEDFGPLCRLKIARVAKMSSLRLPDTAPEDVAKLVAEKIGDDGKFDRGGWRLRGAYD